MRPYQQACFSVTLALMFTLPVLAQMGIVSYWNFDEGSGAVVHDIAGNNDCVIKKDPKWGNGKRGGGLILNGSTNYLDCGNDASFNITKTLTIAVWVNIKAFGNWDGIVTKGVDSGPYAMQMWGDGSLRFSPNWGDPKGFVGKGSFNSTSKMTAGKWTHAAITYDGVKANFYINGKLDKLEVKQAFTFGINEDPLILGCDFPGGDEYFDGVMDEFFIFNQALTQAEILRVMNGGIVAVSEVGKISVAWGKIKSTNTQ